MKHSIIKTTFLALCLSALFCGCALCANLGGGTVDVSALNLRTEPSSAASSEVLTCVPRGSTLIVCENIDSQWCKVIYRGVAGYMSSGSITFSETLNGSFGKGMILGDGVRLRESASASGGTVGGLDYGDIVSVTGVSGAWYKVSYGGKSGYVHSDYLLIIVTTGTYATTPQTPAATQAPTATKAPTATPAPAATQAPATTPIATEGATGADVVALAQQYLGVSYVWGGTSPKGFDCSGLVYYCYKQYGYSLNRVASAMYDNGSYVDNDSRQAGDILYFTNRGGSYIGHVGMYIGDDKFVHASSGGGKVMISSLSESYYANHYYGARRIIA